jgi:hypothetical protein
MIITIQKATELTGKSRSTIERHIKQGVLSKSENGIDTSELLRVYGAFKSDCDTSISASTDVSMTHREQWLMRQIEDLKREHIERERQFIERENKLMALLTHQAEKKVSNGGELWQKVFKMKVTYEK